MRCATCCTACRTAARNSTQSGRSTRCWSGVPTSSTSAASATRSRWARPRPLFELAQPGLCRRRALDERVAVFGDVLAEFDEEARAARQAQLFHGLAQFRRLLVGVLGVLDQHEVP